MAKKTRFVSVREIENAYEVQIQSTTFSLDLENEVHSVIGMLFFQTRSHIQLDLTQLSYIPLPFIKEILALARDLRAKKRVLVLVGIPFSMYHFLHRFHLDKMIFQLKGGMVKRKFQNPLRAKGEFLN